MNKKNQRLIYIITDLFTAALTWLLFNLLRYDNVAQYEFTSLNEYLLHHQTFKVQILIPVFWIILYAISGYYNKIFEKQRVNELFNTFVTTAIGSVFIFFAVVLNDLPKSFHIYYTLFFALLTIHFVLTYIGRTLITWHSYKKIWNHEWMKNAIVIGNPKNPEKLEKELYNVGYKSHFINSDISDLTNIIKEKKTDEIIVATNNDDLQLLYSLYKYKLPVKVVTNRNSSIFSKVKVKTIHTLPLVDMTDNNFSEAGKNIKWLFDKIVAILVLIICSPLYALIAIRVKTTSEGSVFFRQERIGYQGKPFTIYKFRTMYADSAKQGPLLTARDDKRVTPFGHFLRKYRLDEIPQFWNVLRGDMSLVGPRPEQKFFIDRIVQKAPYYYLLHNCRPGITSWGMVKYGYAETVDKMIERLDYDILYYENMSLSLDATILIYTIRTVFTGKGV